MDGAEGIRIRGDKPFDEKKWEPGFGWYGFFFFFFGETIVCLCQSHCREEQSLATASKRSEIM